MSDKRLKQVLDQLGSRAFPDTTDPWMPLQNRLARQQGSLSIGKKTPNLRTRRLTLGIGLALLFLTAVLLVSPEGQVLANVFKHLFKVAAAEQLPIPSAEELATPTPEPTFAVTLVPAISTEAAPTLLPAPTGTPQSALDTCGYNSYVWGYTCWMTYAEKMAGFDAKEFPYPPKEFVFAEVAQDDPGIIMLRYDLIGGGGYLYFTQGIGGQEFRSNLAQDSAIEQVMVGPYQGEFVVGDWVIGGANTTYIWLPCCRERLRWTEGDRWYELDKEASIPQVDYMTRDYMIQMALGMVYHPDPIQSPRADYLSSLDEAAQLAGFTILRPSVLPQAFTFWYASYDKDLSQLKLNYSTSNREQQGVTMVIVETPLDKVSLDSGIKDWKKFEGEKVDVNGYPAIYFGDGSGGGLNWDTADLHITLQVDNATREQILEIGRSMK
jgi:hypothetical protein